MHTLSCPYPRLSLLPGQSQVSVKSSESPDQGSHCDHQVVGRLLLRVAEFGLESGGEELPYGAGTRNFKVRKGPQHQPHLLHEGPDELEREGGQGGGGHEGVST